MRSYTKQRTSAEDDRQLATLTSATERDLKESLLHEGGMTKEDFGNILKSAMNEDDTDIVGLDVFSEPATRRMFEGLAKRYNVSTGGDVVINCTLSLDSKYALIIVHDQADEASMFDEYELRAFDMEKMRKTPAWSIRYAGKYLKVKHID